MAIASLLSICTFIGLLGPQLQPYASFVALAVAFIVAPLIAKLTAGRYYLVRQPEIRSDAACRCAICERTYESEDMAFCPA